MSREFVVMKLTIPIYRGNRYLPRNAENGGSANCKEVGG